MKEQSVESNSWLIHVSKDFLALWQNRMAEKTEIQIEVKKVASDFYLLQSKQPIAANSFQDTIFTRFILPVQYMWPTKLDQKRIIEKCAQGLLNKFKETSFVNVSVFAVERKNHMLASNIRGRLLQVLEDQLNLKNNKQERQLWTKSPTLQDPKQSNLFVAISDKCIWAGVLSPRLSGSFFAGGRRYVGVENDNTASRAAAKYVEASELCLLKGYKLPENANYLELGAAPGGITSELIQRKNHVWAIDNAKLDKKLLENPLVHFNQIDAREFKTNIFFDGIICDMNGPALISSDICSQFAPQLKGHGLIIFTYKIHDINQFNGEFEKIISLFRKNKCKYLFARHMYNNKQEVTVFFKKE